MTVLLIVMDGGHKAAYAGFGCLAMFPGLSCGLRISLRALVT